MGGRWAGGGPAVSHPSDGKSNYPSVTEFRTNVVFFVTEMLVYDFDLNYYEIDNMVSCKM